MNRKLAFGLGLALIVVGLASLAFSAFGVLFHFRFWQLWPIFVIAAGLSMVLPGLFARKRGWGWLLIPGMPILTTGGILLVASVLRWWDVWSVFWPLEVISAGLGFALAAWKTQTLGVWVPAILIGANGFALQFCAVTGWWGAWATLWAIEPVALGLALLILNTQHHTRGLLTTGLALCALGVLGFLQSLAVVSVMALRPLWRIWRWTGPLTVIIGGFILLVWGFVRKSPGAQTGAPQATAITE